MRSFFNCLLILGLISQSGQAQDTIFFDDFETGNANKWDYEDGWAVVQDATNYVFEGEGHKWARPLVYEYYKNTVFQAKFKLIEGGFHFNLLFRSNRYFVSINSDFFHFVERQIHFDSDFLAGRLPPFFLD